MGLDLTGFGSWGDFAKVAAANIGKLIPDVNLRAQVEAQAETEAMAAAQKALELKYQLELSDAKLLQQQIELNKAEAASESWIAKNWRPVLAFGLTVLLISGIAAVITSYILGIKSDFDPLKWAFDLITLFLTALVGTRSVDKFLGTAPSTKTAPRAVPVQSKPATQ